MITISKQEEMEKYYDGNEHTYVFDDDVTFECDIDIEIDNLRAKDIYAKDIKVNNIKSHNLKANNIDAGTITANTIKTHNIDADNILSWDLYALNVEAKHIDSIDIRAKNIKAHDISFQNVCYAIYNIECSSITGNHRNSKYFSLEGEITIKEEIE